MRILVLTSRRIESRQSGYDLRVANLCAHLPAEAHLVAIPLEEETDGPVGIAVDPLFASVEVITAFPPGRERARRYLRASNDHYMRLSRPARFAAARDRLREIVAEKEITHVVVFGVALAELAVTLEGVTTVLDVCDSGALTAERALSGSAHPSHGLQLWKDRLALRRKRVTEGRLPDRFDVVVTISDPDTRAIERLHGSSGVVRTIPNGVDDAFLTPLAEPGTRHGVVFWGNLGFAPNRDALWFFLNEVWEPHLRDAGVELCVVGPNAPSWLAGLAAHEPLIVLTGYVEDLRSAVAPYPVMINPMRTGSGLKNKVLEAFGMGLVVVSTRMGVEAIPEVRDGESLMTAEGPGAFADAIRTVLKDPELADELRAGAHALVEEHYRWEAVGRRWADLFTTAPRAGCAGR
ncbi:glycosyltransferase family 4 protein [Actinomycetospora rhizophila]|uniref:Glycosyltransferase family 4 protein n=1 Tax=Actinomycetospora rhizophila TaxID=1416876 RepID=A0ABV9ZKF8_9PSEU